MRRITIACILALSMLCGCGRISEAPEQSTPRISITEEFSVSRLVCMEYVNASIQRLTSSGSFRKMSEAEKMDSLAALMEELSENGYVSSFSRYDRTGTMSCEYSCGGSCSIMLRPLDPYKN